MYAFTRTPVGRMSNAVRDNPERAQFIGYNPHRIRWISFSVSSFFAGISGGLFAINYEIVNYDTLTLIQNSGIILMTYLGGIRQFWGPILGAIFYTFLWSGLSDYTKAWLLYLGIFFIIFVMFIPEGLAGLFNMHRPVLRARLLHKLIPAYARALFPGIFLAVGVIGLVEMSYNLSLAKEAKTGMKILGVNCDAATAWPWIISVGLASIGFYFFRRSFRSVTTVWDVVNKEAKARLVK